MLDYDKCNMDWDQHNSKISSKATKCWISFASMHRLHAGLLFFPLLQGFLSEHKKLIKILTFYSLYYNSELI